MASGSGGDQRVRGRAVHEIAGELQRMSAALARLAQEAADPSQSSQRATADAAARARSILQSRRLRDRYFDKGLFADPAWDIFLELYLARVEKRQVSISALCEAAAVPATTALRWITRLTDEGLLLRVEDARDARRIYVEITAAVAARMESYLADL